MLAATKSSNWWLEFGAIVLVFNNKTLFFSYVEENDDQFVLMGNNQATKVVRKGSVEL